MLRHEGFQEAYVLHLALFQLLSSCRSGQNKTCVVHGVGKALGNLRGRPNVPISSPQSGRIPTTSARAVVIRASVRLNNEAPRNADERVVAQSVLERE